MIWQKICNGFILAGYINVDFNLMDKW